MLNLLRNNPNKTFSVADFRNYLEKHASQPINRNQLSSATNYLKNNNGVKSPSRDSYKFEPASDSDYGNIDDLTPKVRAILKDAYTKIYNAPDIKDILDIDEKDIPKLLKIKTLTNDIKKLIESF